MRYEVLNDSVPVAKRPTGPREEASMRVGRWLLVVAMLVAVPATALAKAYAVDREHTTVSFRVRHLFTEVQGRFQDFQGTIEFDAADPSHTSVKGTIDAKSIDTDNGKRDAHLRSVDFFDTDTFPEIRFESTEIGPADKATNTATIHGNLTMHGMTRPVALSVKFLGEATDPWGSRKAGFSAETTIDRTQWGLTWNKALETGNVLVGKDVVIRIDVEANAAEVTHGK